jgi:MarR family transcriptional regulator, organic hydroperoxide resistance regulator
MNDSSKQVAGIVDNIRRVFQVINEQSQKVKRETGLTGPQLWTIKTISDSAPINVKDLAQRIYLHPATVVGILNRLEESGLVQRLRSNDDRRVVTVGLTRKGKQLVTKAPEVIQGILVSGLEKLSEKKRDKIDDGLAELVKMLGIEMMPPQLLLSPEVNLKEKRRTSNRHADTKEMESMGIKRSGEKVIVPLLQKR